MDNVRNLIATRKRVNRYESMCIIGVGTNFNVAVGGSAVTAF